MDRLTPNDIMQYPLNGVGALRIMADGQITTIYRMDIKNQAIEPLCTPFQNPQKVQALLRPMEDLLKPARTAIAIMRPLRVLAIAEGISILERDDKEILAELMSRVRTGNCKAFTMHQLHAMLYDTKGLIEQGKAIDLNTIS